MTTAEYLDRLLEPVSRCLTPEAAERLVQLRADPQLQARIDELAGKCTEGELTEDERVEYETYVRTGNVIAILQAKARRLLAACWMQPRETASVGGPATVASTAGFRKPVFRSLSFISNTSVPRNMAALIPKTTCAWLAISVICTNRAT